jgi:hypothetical protein
LLKLIKLILQLLGLLLLVGFVLIEDDVVNVLQVLFVAEHLVFFVK